MRIRNTLFTATVLLCSRTLLAAVGYQLPDIQVPTNGVDPVTGAVEVSLSVSESELGQPASAFNVRFSTEASEVSFDAPQTPTDPLFTEGEPADYSDSDQTVRAAQDLFLFTPNSTPLVDGKGLISVAFKIDSADAGVYALSFTGLNQLVNGAGMPFTLDTTDTGSISVFLNGDYNRDGAVNAADYTVWRDNLGSLVSTAYLGADGDGDGEVDADDYDVWKATYGSALAPGGVGIATPEPTTALLAALGIGGLLLPRRRVVA